MMLKNKSKKRGRSTPWDSDYPVGKVLLRAEEESQKLDSDRPDISFELRGVCYFDLASCTSEGVQKFLWAGIRLLAAKAKAEGLTDADMKTFMTEVFDNFHNTAGKIWEALQQGGISRGGVVVSVRQKAIGPGMISQPPELIVSPDIRTEPQSESVDPSTDEVSDSEIPWSKARREIRAAAKAYSEQTNADY